MPPGLELHCNPGLMPTIYHMLGLPFVNLHNIFGDVCHNRSQTLYAVVHVVLQCGILGHFSRVGEHMQSKTPIFPTRRYLKSTQNNITF